MADWRNTKVYRTFVHVATAEWLIGGTLSLYSDGRKLVQV